MTQVFSPFALPSIRLEGFCPKFYFKKVVPKKNIPNRTENPILQDKRFIQSHQNDLINQNNTNNNTNTSNSNNTNTSFEQSFTNSFEASFAKNHESSFEQSLNQNPSPIPKDLSVTETDTETQIHFE